MPFLRKWIFLWLIFMIKQRTKNKSSRPEVDVGFTNLQFFKILTNNPNFVPYRNVNFYHINHKITAWKSLVKNAYFWLRHRKLRGVTVGRKILSGPQFAKNLRVLRNRLISDYLVGKLFIFELRKSLILPILIRNFTKLEI